MDNGMYSGCFVLFFQHGELLSALCAAHAGTQLQVVCAGGERMSLPAQRVVHAQPLAGLDAENTAQVLPAIAAIEKQQALLAEDVGVAELWETLAAKPALYSSRELACQVFGAGAGDDHAAAVVRALQHDRTYFKFNGERYCALDPAQVEQARLRAAQERSLQAEIETCAEWLHAFVNGQESGGAARGLCAGYLRQFAVFGTGAPQYVHIRSILRQAGLPVERRECFNVLVRMGVCAPDENLLLERHGVPRDWPGGMLAGAHALSDENALHRSDAAGLETWSIDDPGTRDIDDAISCVEEDGGLCIGIHITDAASLLRPGCPLDCEAARRGTTIYLPETAIPMLPPELSEQRLSLVAGHARPVVSVFVSLDSDGAVRRRTLQLGTIRVTRRLSYQDVDDAIRTGGAFKRLHEILMRTRETRLTCGAAALNIPELQVRVDPDRDVVVSVRARETPAQALVAECMILANYSAALFLRDANVPALYRTQKPGRFGAALRREELPLSERVRLRHAFNRTVIETRPRVHAGLGLECYCTITSPIRKYLDLVMQRQLVSAVLAQEPVYAAGQLRDIAAALQPVLNRAGLVENERRRYWVFKKMEPLRGHVLSACVLSRRRTNYTVLLTDFLLELNAEPPEDRSYDPGSEVKVVLRQIDPFEGTIRLELL